MFSQRSLVFPLKQSGWILYLSTVTQVIIVIHSIRAQNMTADTVPVTITMIHPYRHLFSSIFPYKNINSAKLKVNFITLVEPELFHRL